jgi:hypothetical protein
MKLLIVLFFSLTALGNQDKWAVADSATLRLPATAFSQLPKHIARYLQAAGCKIPQSYISSDPHNVIKGEFAKRGQTDWAVLCSRKAESSILIFWGGSTKSVSDIAKARDRLFLQTVNEGTIGFSRNIQSVGRDYILSHYKAYGGPKPPSLTHQGIDDGYLEKASVVLYYYRGRWLKLQGAD